MVKIDENVRRNLKNIIAGEIIFSPKPGEVLKKWRLLFEESQRNLAKAMGVASSVLSDYEKNRRKSPGTEFIRKYVNALIMLDEAKGGPHIRKFAGSVMDLSGIVLGMAEYPSPKTIGQVVSALNGVWLSGEEQKNSLIYGFTIVDSIQAIKRLDSYDFLRLFGGNSVRVVVFTNVSRGRSPIIAAKIFPIRPKMIAIHGPKSVDDVDPLAIELAESEGIPYVLSLHQKIEMIVESLTSLSAV